MKLSSADFMKLTLQEVADMLIDNDSQGAVCKGKVDDKLYNLYVRLEEVK